MITNNKNIISPLIMKYPIKFIDSVISIPQWNQMKSWKWYVNYNWIKWKKL